MYDVPTYVFNRKVMDMLENRNLSFHVSLLKVNFE